MPVSFRGGEGNDENGDDDDSGGKRGLKLWKYLIHTEAFGLYLSFDAAMRGNEQRCGKKSPRMAIKGDEEGIRLRIW